MSPAAGSVTLDEDDGEGGGVAERAEFKDQHLEHWESHRALHKAINRVADHYLPLILELGRRPLTLEELEDFTRRQRILYGRDWESGRRRRVTLEDFLERTTDAGIIERSGRTYRLTPAGGELERHVAAAVPYFVDKFLSPRGVARTTIIVHVLLSAVKLFIGFLSGSAGLISDGIDNTGDTLASVLVALGIRYDRQRLTSSFIIVLMFVSVVGVGWAAWSKIAAPEPVELPWLTLAVSLAAGLLMLVVSAYQYFVGMRHGNFALVCQAVDSRNHFLTSLLVAGGVGLSMLSRAWDAAWLVYADAGASVVIGFLIARSAFELIGELRSGGGEGGAGVRHFLGRGMGKWLETLTERFIRYALAAGPRSPAELQAELTSFISEWRPRFHAMVDFGRGFIESAPALVPERLVVLRERGAVIRGDDGAYTLSDDR